VRPAQTETGPAGGDRHPAEDGGKRSYAEMHVPEPYQRGTALGPGLRRVSENWRLVGSLRECLIGGHVSCCDSSPNRHVTKHFYATEYPLVQSFQPGEHWIWCYVDKVVMEPR
jgi:hypothetical protein